MILKKIGSIIACSVILTAGAVGQMARVYFLNTKVLEEARAKIGTKDPAFLPVYRRLVKDADKLMSQEPVAVVDKDFIPPSGDKRDFVSMARYYWPDPSKPNGLPYMNRDGETNPEYESIPDAQNFGRSTKSAWSLSLTYYFTGNVGYAQKAAEHIRVWFLDSTKGMNPNLDYAQFVKGKGDGRPSGVLDGRDLFRVVDAIGLISPSGAWTSDDHARMVAWMKKHLEWLRTSKNGVKESESTNNHGVWYDVQTVAVACFAGELSVARSILEKAKTERIAKQIEPDGSMPRELGRTRSRHYVMFNLEAFSMLASYGRSLGVDLWHYRTDDGRSVRAAFDWVLPYIRGDKEWTWKEIANAPWSEFYPVLVTASTVYPNGGFDEMAKKIEPEKGASDVLHLINGR